MHMVCNPIFLLTNPKGVPNKPRNQLQLKPYTQKLNTCGELDFVNPTKGQNLYQDR